MIKLIKVWICELKNCFIVSYASNYSFVELKLPWFLSYYNHANKHTSYHKTCKRCGFVDLTNSYHKMNTKKGIPCILGFYISRKLWWTLYTGETPLFVTWAQPVKFCTNSIYRKTYQGIK